MEFGYGMEFDSACKHNTILKRNILIPGKWFRYDGHSHVDFKVVCKPLQWLARLAETQLQPSIKAIDLVHKESMKKVCEICDGTGQISYFKGVSRFLISWEECPECAGLGYRIIADGDDNRAESKKGRSGKRSPKKSKK